MDLPFSTAPIISAQSNPASFETWQHWLFPSSCTNSGCWCLEYIKSMLYFILMKIKPSKASTTPSSSASLYTHAHWSYKHHFSPLALHAGQLAHSNIQLYWNLPTSSFSRQNIKACSLLLHHITTFIKKLFWINK